MPGLGDHHKPTPATVNPYEPQLSRLTEYTAKEIATLQSRLDRQLGPEYISTRPGNGGGRVHYLAAEKVINLANEVFGFNGWSSQIQNVQIDFCDENQSSGKISLGLSVITRVSLKDGTFHEDIGYGHIENCKGKAAAFEKAKKEAATDALKRALRNFGNVLGNCLYDKEYLTRVTKVKIAPSKWDAENLHRHPDFAPIKKEAIADTEHDEIPLQPPRDRAPSYGGIELEDEFGGNFFDEGDLSEGRPDEMVLHDQANQDGQHKSGQPPQLDSAGRMIPMPNRGPQIRRSVSGPMGPPSDLQSRHRIQPQDLHQIKREDFQAPLAPQTRGQIPAKQQAQHLPPGYTSQATFNAQTNGSGQNSITPNLEVLDQSRPPFNHLSTPPLQQGGQIMDQEDHFDLQNQHSAGDPPIGFVTSRHADLLTKNETPSILPSNVRFNPNAESPSIRKTVGVDHGTSKPVNRTDIAKPSVPANINIAPPQLPTATVGGQNAVGRPSSNFVNPNENLGRRIGMPGGGVGSPHSLGRTSAYRPPTIVGGKRLYSDVAGTGGENNTVRPPLADVSNMPQHLPATATGPKAVPSEVDGEGGKRPKMAES